MQPRSLEAILSELGATYQPQVDNLRQRQALIPQQIQDEEKGLESKQQTAFGDILGGARRRGLGFSGIPLQEQARYTADNFLPAMARLRQSGREQAMSLEDAILGINERKMNLGQSMFQNERSMAEQQRQFNEQMALQRQQEQRAAAQAKSGGGFMPTLGASTQQQKAPAATISKKQGGGFAFADTKGTPISAARYAQLNNQDIRDVLYQMGSAGDSYSQQLYNQLAGDRQFGAGNAAYDKKIMQMYSPIFWGTF